MDGVFHLMRAMRVGNCSGCRHSRGQKTRRIERVATDRHAQSIQHSQPILASSRDVTANTAEGPGALHRAKTTRYFLFQLDRAQIALGQIVVKRRRKIAHKSQHSGLLSVQVIDQVLGWALLDPAALSGHGRVWSKGWQSGSQSLPVRSGRMPMSTCASRPSRSCISRWVSVSALDTCIQRNLPSTTPAGLVQVDRFFGLDQVLLGLFIDG